MGIETDEFSGEQKMYRLILAFIIVLIVPFYGCGESDENSSTLQGDFRTIHITDAYLNYTKQPSADKLQQYLQHYQQVHQSHIPSSAKIASQAALVARCLKIDAIYFLSMIRAESSFRTNAVSPTGATGLTQFTGIGLAEVHDQLGRRGTKYARKTTIQYFQGQIQNCILPEITELTTWKPLWQEQNQKRKLIEEPIYALVYGAILLKTNLAVEKYLAVQSASNLELFRKALERYNGDPNMAVRLKYVKNIEKYAAEIFEFLK